MKHTLTLLVVILLWHIPALALERFDIVSTQELHELLTQREDGTLDFHLVNALDNLLANHQSIPGSMNIPWSDVSNADKKIGTDKEKLIIAYCMGYR